MTQKILFMLIFYCFISHVIDQQIVNFIINTSEAPTGVPTAISSGVLSLAPTGVSSALQFDDVLTYL